MARDIVATFPPHRKYIEPFGGAASVLMHKAPCYAEIYNDLDGEVVNVFRVLRDPESAKLLQSALELTPYSRQDFTEAYEAASDPIERARRTIVKSFMGFGSAAIHDPKPHGMRTKASTWRAPTGFRSGSNRSGTTPAHDWRNYPSHIPAFVDRLRGVVIENKPAVEVMADHDTIDALHYCDPPYLPSTRSAVKRGREGLYLHEMTEAQHVELAHALHGLQGMVILSGYRSALYDELFAGWMRVDRAALADGAKKRTECLWFNEAAAVRTQGLLFEERAS